MGEDKQYVDNQKNILNVFSLKVFSFSASDSVNRQLKSPKGR